MARPAHVQHEGDLFLWIEEVIERLGGYADQLIPRRVFSPSGELKAVRLPPTIIDFWDGALVQVRFVIDPQLRWHKYHYQLLVNDEFVCRLDFHPGHEREDGTPYHLHWADGRRDPSAPMDFDEALEYLRGLDPRPPDT